MDTNALMLEELCQAGIWLRALLCFLGFFSLIPVLVSRYPGCTSRSKIVMPIKYL